MDFIHGTLVGFSYHELMRAFSTTLFDIKQRAFWAPLEKEVSDAISSCNDPYAILCWPHGKKLDSGLLEAVWFPAYDVFVYRDGIFTIYKHLSKNETWCPTNPDRVIPDWAVGVYGTLTTYGVVVTQEDKPKPRNAGMFGGIKNYFRKEITT